MWSALALLACLSANAGELFVGVAPSFLVEPYDDVDAVEVGIVPLDLAWRFHPRWFVEARPVLNLRLLEDHAPAISHLGAAAGVHHQAPLGEQGWSLLAGPMVMVTRQRIFEETTVTVGGELGIMARPGNKRFAVAASGQPGINFYPDTPVEGRTVLAHFGVIVRFGWWVGAADAG